MYVVLYLLQMCSREMFERDGFSPFVIITQYDVKELLVRTWDCTVNYEVMSYEVQNRQ